MAAFSEVNIYKLLWTSRSYFKKHIIAKRNWIWKLQVCWFAPVTHFQELQLDHLLYSFGHCETFRPLGFHKCCEIRATQSFFSPSVRIQRAGKERKVLFCEGLKCGVTLELGYDQEKTSTIQSNSNDSKGKCSTRIPGLVCWKIPRTAEALNCNFQLEKSSDLL